MQSGMARQVYEVSLTCSAKQVKLCILDNGMGVNEVSPGFGLLNMRERVEEHGGTIQFESEIEKGFRLQIEFPLQEKTWLIGELYDSDYDC